VLVHDKLFIGGQWSKPSGSDVINVISPTTEEIVGRVPAATEEDVRRAVAAARKAFDEGPWPKMSLDERGSFLLRLADLVEPRLPDAVNAQIDEMGGTRQVLEAHTLSLGAMIRGWVDLSKTVPQREIRAGYAGDVVVLREPVGVVAGVIPWNAPVLFIIVKLLPALLTGCPIIIKPSPDSPLSAYVIADAIEQVGFPEGVFSIIAGANEVGEALVSHRGVDKVSFTGSTVAGRRIASICGDQVKSCTLELGGKSAAIILEDADLDKSIPDLVNKAMYNTGQSCVATTRIVAPSSRYDEVVGHLIDHIKTLKIGDPHEADTDIGPLAGARHREKVEGYIRLGQQEGATLALGGGRPDIAKGWYVEPTVFTNVDNKMRIAQEEIFGPVVSVIRYDGEDDAVRIANDSTYGLGGGVYTSDVEHGLEVAARIRTGSFTINDGPLGGGGGPAGGYKQSGLGREFSVEAFDNHYEFKSIALPAGYKA
jgi:betaine-aldehyde dehydrogenase